jgi:hypothetical protein
LYLKAFPLIVPITITLRTDIITSMGTSMKGIRISIRHLNEEEKLNQKTFEKKKWIKKKKKKPLFEFFYLNLEFI